MDLIDREQTIAALENLEWYHINANGELAEGANSACDTPLYKADDVYAVLRKEPSAEKTGEWIPVTERLPEEDKEVLISYRYKEGEGDTSHADIDITTYGQMYFGGNKVGNNKHWRAPFEYFHSNYEVIAWMPLPEPYKGQANCGARMVEE